MNELHNGLFKGDKLDRLKAKQTIIDHIDQVMNRSYDEDITVERMCLQVGKEPTTKIGTVGQIFQQCPLQTLHNVCHKNLCNNFRGKSLNVRSVRNSFRQQILSILL